MFPKGTFLGRKMAQAKLAIPMWEDVLFDINFARIIELGTARGTFSLYLHLFCIERGADFYTYDNRGSLTKGPVHDLAGTASTFTQMDVLFGDSTLRPIFNLIEGEGITVLFCDNGNKQREVAIFGSRLKPGDLLAVHDWGREINAEHIKALSVPFEEVEVEPVDGITKFFMRCTRKQALDKLDKKA